MSAAANERKRKKKIAVEKIPESIRYFYLQILITPSRRHWSTYKTIFWPVRFLIHSLYWDLRREKEIETRRVFSEQLNPAWADAQPPKEWQASEFLLHWLPQE